MRITAVILLIVLTAGCNKPEQKPIRSTQATMPSDQAVSTVDFDVSLPAGWKTVPAETRAGLFVYQSSDGSSRLTLSVARDTAPSKDLRGDLTQVSSIRRKTEGSQSPSVRLTDMEMANTTDTYSSHWYGTDAPAARRTATLIQISKSKLFTVYVECLDASEDDAKRLYDHILGSFAAK